MGRLPVLVLLFITWYGTEWERRELFQNTTTEGVAA
jgi:hypothetical protein